MSSFPKQLTVFLAETIDDSAVIDTDTGLPIPCVRGFRIDAGPGDRRPKVEILLCEVSMRIATEEARYILDEETLRRLAADNGFDLVKKA